jgi:serine/threonine protein kinase
LVRELDTDQNLTRTGRGLGTPHFMAPEQFRNAKNADARCDIYSLGATLYMAITVELPFRSCSPLDAWMKKIHNDFPPPRKLVPALSERCDWAICRAMSADPDMRPATCREFVEDLTGRSTRKITETSVNGAMHDLWYLVYLDETGVNHTVKGSMFAIRKSLKEGLLGDASNVRVARTKAGPYEPLQTHPEFRDLVIKPAVMQLTPKPGLATPPDVTMITPVRPVTSARTDTPRGSEFPAFQEPAFDMGPLLRPRRKSDWLTWVLLSGLGLVGFIIGLLWLIPKGWR